MAENLAAVPDYTHCQLSLENVCNMQKAQSDIHMMGPTFIQIILDWWWVTLFSGSDFEGWAEKLFKSYLFFVCACQLDFQLFWITHDDLGRGKLHWHWIGDDGNKNEKQSKNSRRKWIGERSRFASIFEMIWRTYDDAHAHTMDQVAAHKMSMWNKKLS